MKEDTLVDMVISNYVYEKVGMEHKKVIRYDKLWHTMKERGISQYDLYHRFHISRSQIHRLRKNENVQVNTLDRLCNILNCELSDVATHFPDDNVF